MKTLLWILVGWLGVILLTALGARLAVEHLVPDWALIVLVFLAVKRSLFKVLIFSLGMGYLLGAQALAPVGVHELALCVCSLAGHFLVLRLEAGSSKFFAVLCGCMVVVYQLSLFFLLYLGDFYVAFASKAAAFLVPQAFMTAVLAYLTYPLLLWFERKLAAYRDNGGLSWT